ncbi:LIM domain only protein 7 isoform X6 [Salmo salar]|uniref:LIM domain only protein 7 isoform X6 n=1 Tax=Salmo salar TaxID=8030 RepID=A0ABM3DQ52_SALSA|nr:LIM domain only protein 7 isoform X6 [Salmo salar]
MSISTCLFWLSPLLSPLSEPSLLLFPAPLISTVLPLPSSFTSHLNFTPFSSISSSPTSPPLGSGSDAETDSVFRMAADSNKDSLHYRRSLVIEPKTTTQFNQFLPTKDKPAAYVPAPLRKKRAERHEDSRRSWASPMYTEEDGTFTRLLQKRAVANDGSKSMTDLAVDQAALKQVCYEELQKIREQVKENEDQWQDDLTKWKNRRKSVNSDIVKKKEEREQIEQTTASSGGGSGGFLRSNRSSIGSRLNSLASLDQDVFEDSAPVLQTRTLPPRSYTIDYTYTPVDRPSHTPPSVPHPREEDPAPTATMATDRAYSPSRGDMSNSSDRPSGSGSDITNNTTTIGRTSNYNRYVPAPTPSERAPTPSERAPTPSERAPRGAPTLSERAPRGAPTPSESAPTPSERAPSPALRYTSAAKTEETSSTTTVTTPSFLPKLPEPRRPWAGKVAEEVTTSTAGGSLYKLQPQYNSVAMEPKPMPPSVSRVSASLPRSYMKSDSALLTSVVTPRPFGSQSTCIASLPRAYTKNGEMDVTKKSSVPSRYSQVMTSEDESRSHSNSANSSGGEEEEEEEEEKRERVRGVNPTLAPTLAPSPVPSQARSPFTALQPPKVASPALVSLVRAKDTNQESYSDMRISLNQKPNSSRDFGFQTEWDSTGAHVTSIQPGSPAELCQLQVGDEVLAVSGHRVAEMSYGEWKSSTEQALQQGSLTMDIRRHGRNNWDRDLPSLPCKSHKTINLTSMNHHPTLIGSSNTATVNSTTSLAFTSQGSIETTKEIAIQQIIDVASIGVNGGFHDETVTMRNKESVEPISLKNLKRRSEFFEQGGSDSAISDMPVPSIAPSSNHWSWDLEEERRRQEKWQKEQERLLQEKYSRDQEKLEEEWRRAQQDAVTEGGRHHQEEPSSKSISLLCPLRQPILPWEDQEEERRRRRKEEEEAQRRQEEEKRKMEEEQRWQEERMRTEERDLLRLQKERKREKQKEEERRQRKEEELRWQRRKEEEREDERKHQEAANQQHMENARMQEQQQWAKSKSTPELDDVEKPENKSWYGRSGGMAQKLLEEELRRKADKNDQSLRAASELELERRNILNAMRYREPERVTSSGGLGEASWRNGQQSLSQAELERQQILQEMKKKTQLATDNSWIRQRTTTSKDPAASLISRGESLDNLDTAPRSSWRSSWSTSSIPNYSSPHSALSSLNTTSSHGDGGYGGGGYSGSGVGGRPGSATLPFSLSMSSLRGAGGSNPSPWSQCSPSPSPSPTTSPGLEPESRPSSQQRSRSVSGKKICTFCETALGKGAAMIIESLGLCYHLTCFKCIDCKSDLGGSEAGAEVRIRNRQLYCNSCYMRFKTGQPTSM